MVVGVEAGGDVFAYEPSDGIARPPKLDAEGNLEGAAALDDSKGHESIQLVWCATEFRLADVRAKGPWEPVAPPDGCRTAMVRIDKQ